MTPADAAKVLLLVQVYDNRQFDETTARVWADALDGLELGDCLDAVRIYYRQTKAWLMPSDLREQARSVIRGRLELERRENERLAIEAANLTPEVIAERADTVRRAAAGACAMPVEESPHPKQDTVVDRKARKVSCPWCKATVGQGCVNTATGKPVQVTHERRLVAAGLIAEPSKAAVS